MNCRFPLLDQKVEASIQKALKMVPKNRASSVLLFPTFFGLSYFFLLLGKIPTFSCFFRFLLKLIDKKPKRIFGLISLGIISFGK